MGKTFNWKSRLQDFLLGGGIIAVAGYFIRHQRPDVAALMFCSPLGFIYLYLSTLYRHGEDRTFTLTKWVLYSSLTFLVYVALIRLLQERGVHLTLAAATFCWIGFLVFYLLVIAPRIR